MTRASFGFWWALGLGTLAGCDGAAPGVCEVVPGTQTEQQADWVARLNSEFLSKNASDLVTKAEDLASTLRVLCATPEAGNLTTAQDAWRQFRLTVKTFDMFVIGPLVSERLHAALQFWPTRPNLIEDKIRRTPEAGWTVADLTEIGTAASGSTALEYLLFDSNVPLLDSADFEARCAYAVVLGDGLVDRSKALDQAWNGAGGFGESLSQAGRGSTIYSCVRPAVDELANALASGLKQLYDQKTGVPLGTKTGGILKPDEGESARSGFGLDEIEATLKGVRVAWSGAGEGNPSTTLKGIVANRNAQVAQWYEGVLVDAEAKVAVAKAKGQMTSLLREGHTEELEAMRIALKELYRGFAVELGSVLGTRLSFSDNDGD